MARRLGICSLVLLLVAGCSTGPEPWQAPDADRPVVDLAFTMADDLSSAQGIENITFTPNGQVCEVVLRAWPNAPLSEGEDTALSILSVTSGGRALPLTVEKAGAAEGSPGTLVRAKLPQCVRGGTSVSVQAHFDVTLGEDVDNRLGTSSDTRMAWLGTAFPMLAWVNGEGWATEPAVRVVGESETSETFALRRLDITAPDGDAVAGVGTPQGTMTGATPGTTLHRFSADAVRDVTFTVGDLTTTDFEVDGTTVTLVNQAENRIDTAAWEAQISTSLRALTDQFGPVPYDHLWITIVPSISSGVEYPGAVQFADVDPEEETWLVAHELAHMWFYGLVGNNQGRDPWLDEAFATYAQELVEPTDLSGDTEEWLGAPATMGKPLSAFATNRRPSDAYVASVYRGGGRTLIQARQADDDPDRFDAAIEAYLREQAHHVATPADLARHLSDLPQAVAMLKQAGALPS